MIYVITYFEIDTETIKKVQLTSSNVQEIKHLVI